MRVPLCISDNPSNYRSTYLILHINIHVYIHTPYTYYIEYIYNIYYIFVSLFKYHILHRPRGHGPLWPGALPSRPLCPRHLATLSAARAWWSQEMAIFFGWKFTKENGDGNRSLGNTWLKVYSKCESWRCIHIFGAIYNSWFWFCCMFQQGTGQALSNSALLFLVDVCVFVGPC